MKKYGAKVTFLRPIKLSQDMVGHKLVEFSPTWSFVGHTPADKKAAAESQDVASNKPDTGATDAKK